MRILCRHCQAQLSRDEYFCFYDSCTACEHYRQTAMAEQALAVKSPVLALYAMMFFGRRVRFKCAARLRAARLL